MFKFDNQQALVHQTLGSGEESCVYPYLEGQNESKWVVKCIKVNDPEKVNTILQNALITSNTAYSDLVVPIKGHDVQRDGQGNATVYIKMQRMQQSLKDVIQKYQASKQTAMPLEQVVGYFYSITTALEELAEQDIAHQNLKPSNILMDKEDLVYLSDLKVVKRWKAKNLETRDCKEEDLLYKAPETLLDDWEANNEDLFKSDAWSLGMMIAQTCLLDNLIPISTELPVEENKDIIEKNIVMISDIYGADFAEIVRGLLALNPGERGTLSTTRRLLEVAFPTFVDGHARNGEKASTKIEYSIDMREEPRSGLIIETHSLSDEKFYQMDKKNYSLPRWMRKENLLNGLRKGKEYAKTHKIITVVLISLLTIATIFTIRAILSSSKPNRFEEIVTDLQSKHGQYFDITFDRSGTLNIVGIWNEEIYYQTNYENPPTDSRLNNTIMGNLINDMATQLKSAELEDYLLDFRLVFLEGPVTTDKTLTQLQAFLARLKKLERVAIEELDGPYMSSGAILSLFNSITEQLEELQSVTIGLGRRSSIDDISHLAFTVLRKAKKLTAFHLHLENTDLENFVKIAQEISNNGQNLKTLGFALPNGLGSQYSPYSVYEKPDYSPQLLRNLKNLTDLDLDLRGSYIDDNGLRTFAKSISSNVKKLQTLKVSFEECNMISDKGLREFGSRLSQAGLKDLRSVTIQTPRWESNRETRAWLRDQLKSIPEVIIKPE